MKWIPSRLQTDRRLVSRAAGCHLQCKINPSRTSIYTPSPILTRVGKHAQVINHASRPRSHKVGQAVVWFIALFLCLLPQAMEAGHHLHMIVVQAALLVLLQCTFSRSALVT